MNRVQDIAISDASLKAEFITRFFNGEYSSAFNIISSNPQLDSKAFLANVMNEIANILSLLQNNFQNEVINYLSNQLSNFQHIIDNYISKQEWDSTITYQIYNFVTYNNIVYLYINSTQSSGNLPTNTEYWLEVGLQGEKGAPGLGVSLKYIWNAETSYNALDVVSYEDSLWVAKVDNYNVPPGTEEFWQTLDGGIITFTNDGTVNINSLSVAVEPVQAGSGDPSPDNVRPISGWDSVEVERTGKNLWNGAWVTTALNVEYTGAWQTYYIPGNLALPVTPGASYTFSVNGAPVLIRYAFLDAQKNQIGGLNNATTVTAPANAHYLKWRWYGDGSTSSGDLSQSAQLENGSAATDFKPYAGNTYTIALGQTVYGGTLDATAGTLTVDRAMVDMGQLSWVKESDPPEYRASLNDMLFRSLPLCSAYKGVIVSSANQIQNGEIASTNSQALNLVRVRDDQKWQTMDASAFRAAVSGVQFVYELATPITIQLDPVTISAIAGQTNNVWADAGAVSVELTKSSWETFLNFKLIKIYSNQNAPTGDDLYDGVIWFEILNS